MARISRIVTDCSNPKLTILRLRQRNIGLRSLQLVFNLIDSSMVSMRGLKGRAGAAIVQQTLLSRIGYTTAPSTLYTGLGLSRLYLNYPMRME